MIETAFIVAAYLIGSLSFAVLVSRAMGLPDPHTYGSGNPGATNVMRTGKRSAAVATLIGDAGKGVVAVLLAKAFAERFAFDERTVAAVALAVFVGHLFPIFFRFKGGKGVATAAGVLLALDLRVGLGTLATWLIIFFFFRYSSLAALIAAIFAPFAALVVFGLHPYTLVAAVMALLLIWRHKANIARLLAGQESRVGEKKQTVDAGVE